MKKQVAAILWRRVLPATLDTLGGVSKGQFDIRLSRAPDISNFFEGLERHREGDRGGHTIKVPIEPFEGADPVPAWTLPVKYAGPNSVRRDWRIASQRPDTAYPLWRKGRSPVEYELNPAHYIVIVRDIDGKYHSRWLSPEALERLPEKVGSMLKGNDIGVYNSEASRMTSLANDVYNKLQEHHNVLIYGPPGTGKTHIMQQVVHLFREPQLYIDTQDEANPITAGLFERTKVGWVTFHQSYSYEEFIVGLRPDPTSKQLLSLVPTPGVLLELAEFARQPGNSALLVIDEINRGNVSRIFGEFITLLEPDKRLGTNGNETPSTVKVQLPYIKSGSPVHIDVGGSQVEVANPFAMPCGLYTLASMNSVDKSIAPLDSALRRRFHTYDLPPDLDAMSRFLGLGRWKVPNTLRLQNGLVSADDVKKLALALLNYLNRGISFYLGPEYTLGQWYLSDLNQDFESADEAAQIIGEIWEFSLLPQLEELFSGRIEQLETVLRLNGLTDDGKAPVYLERPESSWQDVGATPFLRKRRVDASSLTTFLGRVVGVQGNAALQDESSTVVDSAEGNDTGSEPKTQSHSSLDDGSDADEVSTDDENA